MAEAATMKAIVQPRYGAPESVQLRDVPVPEVGEGQVLVRNHASSVNAADTEILGGFALVRMAAPLRPKNRIVGSDVAGIVERIGQGVTELRAGDEVIGDLSEHGYGAFAEYVAAPVEALHRKPPSLSLAEAAAVPSAAWVAIKAIRDHRQLGPGSEALINGAGGGMGTFALQMAKARGATVTGVDNASKLDLISSLGAARAIDYRSGDVIESDQRYDLIIDVQARRSVRDWQQVLTPDGAYLMVGGSTWRILHGVFAGMVISQSSDMKLGIMPGWPHEPRDMEDVDALIESGAVRPVIERTYPLEEAAAALRHVADGKALGKVVVTIGIE